MWDDRVDPIGKVACIDTSKLHMIYCICPCLLTSLLHRIHLMNSISFIYLFTFLSEWVESSQRIFHSVINRFLGGRKTYFIHLYFVFCKTSLKYSPFFPLCVRVFAQNQLYADRTLYFVYNIPIEYIAQFGFFWWYISWVLRQIIVHPMSFVLINRSQCRTTKIICLNISILNLLYVICTRPEILHSPKISPTQMQITQTNRCWWQHTPVRVFYQILTMLIIDWWFIKWVQFIRHPHSAWSSTKKNSLVLTSLKLQISKRTPIILRMFRWDFRSTTTAISITKALAMMFTVRHHQHQSHQSHQFHRYLRLWSMMLPNRWI